MAQEQGRIVGDVTYREGDGISIKIPRGPCEIERAETDVTLTWTDGATHGAAAIPLSDFARYVQDGAIAVDTPQP